MNRSRYLKVLHIRIVAGSKSFTIRNHMALFDRIQNNTTLFMHFFFFIFLYFSPPINIKTFPLFHFYITSIIFYSLQSKTFSLFYTFFKIFISNHHFLQIPKLTTYYYVMFCTVLDGIDGIDTGEQNL
jgi:hypothetical protein